MSQESGISGRHTPGPWETQDYPYVLGAGIERTGGGEILIMTENGDIGAVWWGDMKKARPENIADARLMAASPDLLRAAKDALVNPTRPLARWQLDALGKAIAKAEGESSESES